MLFESILVLILFKKKKKTSQHFQNSGCNILVNVLNSLLCFLCLIRGILHKSNIRDYAVIFQLSWLNLALTQLHESRLN